MTFPLLLAHDAVLRSFASPRALLAFDFDGTLAPIVPDREAAVMRPETEALFTALCTRCRCAVISGRARADVAARLGRARPWAIIGNHGAEPDDDVVDHHVETSGAQRDIAGLMRDVGERLRDAAAHGLLAGVDVEDKQWSLSVHLPQNAPSRADVGGVLLSPAMENLQVALLDVLRPWGSAVRLVPGHHVFNVVAAAAASKGDALRRLIAIHGASPVLFVGDDVTDEEAFRLPPSLVVGVRVGLSADSAASFFLPHQVDMDSLLQRLLSVGVSTPLAAASAVS